MLQVKNTSQQERRSSWSNSLRLGFVILILAIMGVCQVGDYGISSDEIPQIEMVQKNLELIKNGRVISGDLSFYGPAFNLLSEITYDITSFLDPHDTSNSESKRKKLLKRIKVKHYCTFLFSLVAYFCIAALVGILFDWRYAWVAPIVLMLCPRFWGHSFYNPKDIPFAVLFTLCTYRGSKLLGLYLVCRSKDEIGSSNIIKETIKYGLLLGIFCGVRIGGFVLIFFVITTHLVTSWLEPGSYTVLRFKTHYSTLITFWQAATAICYPSIWFSPFVIPSLAVSYMGPDSSKAKFISNHILFGRECALKFYAVIFFLSFSIWIYSRVSNVLVPTDKKNVICQVLPAPLGGVLDEARKVVVMLATVIFQFFFGLWFLSAIIYFSKHSWTGSVLFEGKFYSSHNLPWYYIPKWLAITIPIPLLLAFVIGLVLIIRNIQQFTAAQKSATFLILMQILVLPLAAILLGSTLYDAIRHFLFVIPCIATVSTISFIWIYTKLKTKVLKIAAVALFIIMCLETLTTMGTLHPYECVYFNRFVGGLRGAYLKYETDYWGLSIQQALNWINNRSTENCSTIVTAAKERAQLLALPTFNIIHVRWNKTKAGPPLLSIPVLSPPFYYIARQRWRLQDAFPQCKVVYEVRRSSVPLCVVKKCD